VPADDRHPDLLEELDALPCGSVRTDSDGLILRVNRTFCTWTGYARDELTGSRRLQELFTTGGRIFHQTHWQPLLQIQGSVAEVKLEIVHRDGRTIPMVINAIRREHNGTLVHDIAAYVAYDRDKYERELLSSRRKLQVAVDDAKQAQAQARDRATVAEQMMGVVSHDLRNPLSTISMGAAVLTQLGPTPQQQTVIKNMQRATARMTRLIADLLDFTQGRIGGGLKVSARPFPLHETVHEALEELALAFPGRELKHCRHGSGDVTADPDRVLQLVGNLVANAIAYGDPGAAVEVDTRIDDESFLVAVRNQGLPIPAELLPHLFEPLSRGDAKGEKSSLGLGLFIVDQIAKAHGGAVHVQSDALNGTAFEARFPQRR
jgi:phosphoserine phosphatase RsbU/P